jgi:hypothetical protein
MHRPPKIASGPHNRALTPLLFIGKERKEFWIY